VYVPPGKRFRYIALYDFGFFFTPYIGYCFADYIPALPVVRLTICPVCGHIFIVPVYHGHEFLRGVYYKFKFFQQIFLVHSDSPVAIGACADTSIVIDLAVFIEKNYLTGSTG